MRGSPWRGVGFLFPLSFGSHPDKLNGRGHSLKLRASVSISLQWGSRHRIRIGFRLKLCHLLSSVFPRFPSLELFPGRLCYLGCLSHDFILVPATAPVGSLPSPPSSWVQSPLRTPYTPLLLASPSVVGSLLERLTRFPPPPRHTQLYNQSLPLSAFSIRGWESADTEG